MYSYGFFRQTVEGAMDKQVGFALIAGDPFHKVVINLLTPPLYVHISNGYNGSNTLEKSLTAKFQNGAAVLSSYDGQCGRFSTL